MDRRPEILVYHFLDGGRVKPIEVGRDGLTERGIIRLIGPEFGKLDGDDLKPEAVAQESPTGALVPDFATPEPITKEEPTGVRRGNGGDRRHRLEPIGLQTAVIGA